ncbi:MAG: 4-hydroxy-tetrahydrodipicolinate reductase [Erythrobacter sp.]|uniref:4-hydroxy-tetrahydrodipicolinate reductase n=1 Tax=Erythrobacter sp. HL-111 TaxID=1798193 RepID=UPI0006D9870F|nr:4-hydroxy-tetrahydrodipicolinate reductase [Erythrobacter sp. HL-111]KPP94346.1 MAG: dihydrodipicolinate reductase DhpR [Erythrobacteraceae bacterium HL-111]SDS51794.1 dihydrodipicolinate reductase [Erythrobacter sp. HL-111]
MSEGARRFAVIGHKGRMGRALADAIEQAGHEFRVGVDRGGDPEPLFGQCEVAVDFSAPDGLKASLAAARAAGIPILIGTTGLGEEHFAMIAEAAKAIPVLQTGNTSLGITLLAHLVREAAARLGPEWDIEVLEMHHRMKVDSPSGTAKLLGEAAAEARGIALTDNMESGRHGFTGERRRGAIGFATLRGGTVAGEHSVIFAGEEERITLAHSAEDRAIFARGAVKGALWLIGREPGRYRMEDVLGL